MPSTDYSSALLDAAERELCETSPIFMVNLVRYRVEADYGGDARFAPCSGREAYLQRYAPAFGKVAAAERFAVAWLGAVSSVIVAPNGEDWDDIVIVQYSDFASLRRILDSPTYEAEAAPHRRAALEDWRFIATTRLEMPA